MIRNQVINSSRFQLLGTNKKMKVNWSRFMSSNSHKSRNEMIGFIGLGNMGLPMLKNLLKETKKKTIRTDILAYDINSAAMSEAKEAGAIPSSLEEIAESNPKVIFTVLPNCEASSNVISELLSGGKKSRIHDDYEGVIVDCSTVSVSTSKSNHKLAKEHLYQMLDAPISGGVKGAEARTLTFMVGTPSLDLVSLVEPYLMSMGSTIKICGGPNTGAASKLCNNLALATQMIGICEAMNLGRSLGIDPVTLADVMNTSTASCWSSKVNNPDPDVSSALKSGAAANGYAGGFATDLMLKDLRLAVAAGKENDLKLPLGQKSKELYEMSSKNGFGKKDFGSMMNFLKDGSLKLK